MINRCVARTESRASSSSRLFFGRPTCVSFTSLVCETHCSHWRYTIGKYEPLRDHLVSRPKRDPVTMSFAEVEAIVGSLPLSARAGYAWWMNTTEAGAKAWTTAGWSVRSVDLSSESVVFVHKRSLWRGWSKRHQIIVGVFVAVVATLIAALIIGVISRIDTPGNSAAAIATQVSRCIHDHGMSGASVGPIKPPKDTYVPFSQANQGQDIGWKIGTHPYGGGPIPVTLYEACSWPAPPGADPTGYSRILVSTVPGDPQYGGISDPTSYADVLDTSCRKVRIIYVGGEMSESYSNTVTVSRGQIMIADPGTLDPRKPTPKSVDFWARSMNYYVTPGETVVLHAGLPGRILSISCIS